MYTYEATKLKAVDTITHGATAILLCNNHEEVKKLANSLIEAAKLILWLEDLAIAQENGDLEGMFKAKTNNGF